MAPPDIEALVMRATLIGGHKYTDDHQVFWRGLPIGRIMKQQYTPLGKPNWWFGVSLYGRPQLARDIGMCRNFAEAKARFNETWTSIRAALTDEDIARARDLPQENNWGAAVACSRT